jgi:hypothetical protein
MAGQRLTDKTALEEQAGSGDLLMVVDVNDTTGSSAGTSKKMDFKYVIQTDKFSLSNADVQALNTTPKILVGALSGYMVTPFNVTILTTYASSTETSASNLYFGYDSSQTTLHWDKISRMMHTLTTSNTYVQGGAVASGGGVYTASIINRPFEMWSNSAFNGGWSADVYITYAYTKIL